jgi:DNA-binding GntR family transcriptional regulator
MPLTDTIEQDLIAHLKQGSLPCHLSIAALAKHYQTSSTPIRPVVNNLVEMGLLEKLANGRLKNKIQPNEPNLKIPKDNSLASSSYELIIREIVHGSLSHKEVFIREESTAQRYSVTRSHLREILLQLSGQGLLEHIPRRGWRVRPFTQKDLNNYCEVREVMELKALDLAWGKLLDIDLQSMLKGNILPQNNKQKPIIDNRLHAYIIEKADNFYIKDFFNKHEPFFKVLFEWEGENRAAAIEAIEQNHDILNALLSRDKKAAKKALLNHIHHNHPVLKNLKIQG